MVKYNFLESEVKNILDKNKISIDNEIKFSLYPDFHLDNKKIIIECKDTKRNIQEQLYSVAGKRLYAEREGYTNHKWILVLKADSYSSQIITFGKICFDIVLPYERLDLLNHLISGNISYDDAWKEVIKYIYESDKSRTNCFRVYSIVKELLNNNSISVKEISNKLNITYSHVNKIILILYRKKFIDKDIKNYDVIKSERMIKYKLIDKDILLKFSFIKYST